MGVEWGAWDLQMDLENWIFWSELASGCEYLYGTPLSRNSPADHGYIPRSPPTHHFQRFTFSISGLMKNKDFRA